MQQDSGCPAVVPAPTPNKPQTVIFVSLFSFIVLCTQKAALLVPKSNNSISSLIQTSHIGSYLCSEPSEQPPKRNEKNSNRSI